MKIVSCVIDILYINIIKLSSKIYLRFKEHTLYVNIAGKREGEKEVINNRKCK